MVFHRAGESLRLVGTSEHHPVQPMLKAGPATAASQVWTAARMESPQPLWTASVSFQTLSLKKKKKRFPMFKWSFPKFQYVPITSCPFTGYHWEPGSVSTSSHQTFVLMNKIPFSGVASSCCLEKGSSPSALLSVYGKCSPLIALLSEWPSSSQLIHLKAEFHQLSLHSHAKCKTCCGSSLPSPVIPVPIFCPTWPGRPCLSVATFDSQRRSHFHGI